MGWAGVFLLFFALPLGILYEGYRYYLANVYVSSRDRLAQYYTRELTSLRSHVSNERVLMQIARTFREAYRRAVGKPERQTKVFAGFQSELPTGTRVLVWDENLVPRFAEGWSATGKTLAASLPRFFEENFTRSSVSLGLQAGEGEIESDLPVEQKTAWMDLAPVIGRNFPIARAVAQRGKWVVWGGVEQNHLFLWDSFSPQPASSGGYLLLIDGPSLAETFGLSYLLPSDPSSNPEFSNGFVHVDNPGQFQIAFPQLASQAGALFAQYRRTLDNPVMEGDWHQVLIPLTEASGYRLFTIFSSERLRREFTDALNNGFLLAFLLFAGGLVAFWYSYQRARREGLSIRFKVAALFFLSMLLPLSLLMLIGLHFSLDRAKILGEDASQRLRREIRRLDDGLEEHYRERRIWLSSLPQLPEVVGGDLPTMAATFEKSFQNQELERVYLVDAQGAILFNQDRLLRDEGPKPFLEELGRKIIDHARSAQAGEASEHAATDALSRGFLDQLVNRRGQIQEILWPGNGKPTLIFADLVGSPTIGSGTRALIVTIDKSTQDREYIRSALAAQRKRDPHLRFFVLNRDDITDSIPELSPTFKANLLPLISVTQVRDTGEAEPISDEDRQLLAAMLEGRRLGGFLLGAFLDWNQVMESVYRMYAFVVTALFLSIVGSLFLVLILSRGFVAPISILSQSTRAIAAGDLTRVLPVMERDELGDLSLAFNEMTRRLRNRLTELTVLYNLTQKASTSHNQREVFDLAAHNLREHLGGSDCGIAWINEGEGRDNLYLVEPREAILGASIRKAVLAALSQRTFHLEPLPDGQGLALGIPLYFEDKEFGGVYLLFAGAPGAGKTVKTLTPEDRSFMETLRHHLSLIIEKQRLFEQAITDGLTRLYVRRFFLATLDKELTRGKRYRTEISLLLLDIDHFKRFNDSYGHQAGDLVLRETAQRIIESIRAVDTPGRYGGEELCVILPQTPMKDAILVAERIRKAIAGTAYTYNEHQLQVTVSIGVTSLAGRSLSMEEFVEECDRALYRAKDRGRNRTEAEEPVPGGAPPANVAGGAPSGDPPAGGLPPGGPIPPSA